MPEALTRPIYETHPVGDDTVHSFGAAAVSRTLAPVQPEIIGDGFTWQEVAVLSHISEGQTGNQIARHLEMDRADVLASRRSAMSKFDTSSIAQAVDRAIQGQVIPVKIRPDEAVTSQISPADAVVLRFFAQGGSNRQIATKLDVGLKEVEAYHDQLLEKIKAWSRPHAIRRAYELGIFETNEDAAYN